ncbi:MAG: hypothetical protein GY853_02675 [PVC group bacterium]|nr:hypothetical protein [PVC group bacterium]
MEQEYFYYQIRKEKEFEDICLRCGNCCGIQDDPCVHLVEQPEGKYLCDIYASRQQGKQKTHSGNLIKCVFIREILYKDWPGNWNCAYKKKQ